MVELTPLLVFFAVAAFVGVAASGIAFRFVLRRFGLAAGKPWAALSLPGRVFRGTVLGLAATGLLAISWGFAEPYFPQLETVVIPTPKVTAPIRIVQVSDLHCDPEVRAEEKVIRMIRGLAPHLIVFTGDGVNSDEGIPTFRKTMRALSKIAPLFGVRGNWEAWWFTHVDTFKHTGIRELTGPGVPVTVAGQRIWLVGAAVDREKKLSAHARALPKKSFRIALHHFPSAIRLVDGNVDLLLTGDTHGGQLNFPLIGPLVRIRRWGDRFHEAGLHTAPKGTPYYVNRGIGMEGHRVPRVRLNVPPEVTLLEIRPE